MKLSPPASSSDLDQARAIAQRLSEGEAAAPPPAPPADQGYVRFPPHREVPPRSRLRLLPPQAAAPASPPPIVMPPSLMPALTPAAAAPSPVHAEPPEAPPAAGPGAAPEPPRSPERPSSRGLHGAGQLDLKSLLGGDTRRLTGRRPASPEPHPDSGPSVPPAAATPPPAAEPETVAPAPVVEPASVPGEESAEEPPFEIAVSTDEADAVTDPEINPLAALAPEEAPAIPAPPSWDEVLGDCLFLARARGAMLLDGKSNLLAAAGDWPAGRVEALTTRLIPAIEKSQKSNPGEPLSVRLSGAVLTAWRVSAADDLLTVAFLAESPVPYDAFPGVQSALRRHAG